MTVPPLQYTLIRSGHYCSSSAIVPTTPLSQITSSVVDIWTTNMKHNVNKKKGKVMCRFSVSANSSSLVHLLTSLVYDKFWRVFPPYRVTASKSPPGKNCHHYLQRRYCLHHDYAGRCLAPVASFARNVRLLSGSSLAATCITRSVPYHTIP